MFAGSQAQGHAAVPHGEAKVPARFLRGSREERKCHGKVLRTDAELLELGGKGLAGGVEAHILPWNTWIRSGLIKFC